MSKLFQRWKEWIEELEAEKRNIDPRDNFWLNNDDVHGNDFLVEENDDLGLSPDGECAILP